MDKMDVSILSDKSIFSFLDLLKNEYSLVTTVFLLPIFRWIWKKYKKATPWEEPKSALDGSEDLERKEKVK
jgi:hypothetical protein